jgi:hypothetical protein
MTDTADDTLAVRYARALGVAEATLMIVRIMVAGRSGCDDLVCYLDEALARVEEMPPGGPR